jgi:hypothetical protein
MYCRSLLRKKLFTGEKKVIFGWLGGFPYFKKSSWLFLFLTFFHCIFQIFQTQSEFVQKTL